MTGRATTLAAAGRRGPVAQHDQHGTDAAADALAVALEARDRATYEHSLRVAELSTATADRLDLEPAAVGELALAARLHDVGKIGLPDSILRKPAALDPDEWRQMQRHVTHGAEMIGAVPALGPRIGALARAHHERWDGRGYPDGLARERIPLASRVISACDAFDSLSSDRPYRAALDPAAALEQVREAAGSQLDPTVVEALIDAVHRRPPGAADPSRLRSPGRFQRAQAPPRAASSAEHEAKRQQPHGAAQARSGLLRVLNAVDPPPALIESRDRLLGMLETDADRAGGLVATIESDIALAIALLRTANQRSARRRHANVPDAVAALERKDLRALVARVPAVDFFSRHRSLNQPLDAFRLHAIATQRAADRLAREIGFDQRDELLVSALLHDVGKFALGEGIDGYPGRVHGDADTPDQRVHAERLTLGLDHAAVGALLARRWGLPERTAKAIHGHHSDDAGTECTLIRLADQLAHHGHGDPVDPGRLLELGANLGLDPKALRAIMFELPQAAGSLRRRSDPCPLTPRQLDVLRGLAAGKVYKQIANDLGLSTSTVRTHLHTAYEKLGTVDRAQAVLAATERGWL